MILNNFLFQAAPVTHDDEFLKVVEQIRKVSASIGPTKVWIISREEKSCVQHTVCRASAEKSLPMNRSAELRIFYSLEFCN